MFTHLLTFKHLPKMAKISLDDIIFATISMRGKILARLRLDGISSYSEILSRLLKSVAGLRGMATVDIRNSSQGWTTRKSVMLSI